MKDDFRSMESPELPMEEQESQSSRSHKPHNHTQLKAMLLMAFCTLFTSGGQILWKWGMKTIDFSQWVTFLNVPFLLGFVSYGVGAALMILALKKGELSFVYPVAATSYIWVSLISPRLFPTDIMNIWKWSGVVVILLAVSILGYGSSQHVPQENKIGSSVEEAREDVSKIEVHNG